MISLEFCILQSGVILNNHVCALQDYSYSMEDHRQAYSHLIDGKLYSAECFDIVSKFSEAFVENLILIIYLDHYLILGLAHVSRPDTTS